MDTEIKNGNQTVEKEVITRNNFRIIMTAENGENIQLVFYIRKFYTNSVGMVTKVDSEFVYSGKQIIEFINGLSKIEKRLVK